MGLFRRKKKDGFNKDLVQYIAIRIISACAPRSKFTPREEFDIAAQELIDKGKLNQEQIPALLDKICKMKGNAGEVGREIRDQIRRET